MTTVEQTTQQQQQESWQEKTGKWGPFWIGNYDNLKESKEFLKRENNFELDKDGFHYKVTYNEMYQVFQVMKYAKKAGSFTPKKAAVYTLREVFDGDIDQINRKITESAATGMPGVWEIFKVDYQPRTGAPLYIIQRKEELKT